MGNLSAYANKETTVPRRYFLIKFGFYLLIWIILDLRELFCPFSFVYCFIVCLLCRVIVATTSKGKDLSVRSLLIFVTRVSRPGLVYQVQGVSTSPPAALAAAIIADDNMSLYCYVNYA